MSGALNCGEVYNNAGNNLRRLYNQAWFDQITIDAEYDEVSCTPERTELMDTLHRSARALHEMLEPANPAHSTPRNDERDESLRSRPVPHAQGSTGLLLVEPRGLEPLTPCLQSRCATNCAMAPRAAAANVSRPVHSMSSVTSVHRSRSSCCCAYLR